MTTKLWTSVNTYQKTIDRINASMEALGVDYLDGLLIHWPHNNNREVWTAMEDLYFQGKLRSIGVSNFKEHHIEKLKRFARIMPMVNQVELHPEFRQFELQEYCKKEGILVEAWSPLMRGEALNIPLIKELAEKHNATPSQIILAWDIKEGIAVIPKSTKIARMAENFNALSVNLSDGEVESLNKLHNGVRRYRNPDNHGFGNQGEL